MFLALARQLGRALSGESEREVAAVVGDPNVAREVFFLRPLGFITPTAARRIGYEESLRFELVHEQVYAEHGFTVVDVPAGDVATRVRLVLSGVSNLLGRAAMLGWHPPPST